MNRKSFLHRLLCLPLAAAVAPSAIAMTETTTVKFGDSTRFSSDGVLLGEITGSEFRIGDRKGGWIQANKDGSGIRFEDGTTYFIGSVTG